MRIRDLTIAGFRGFRERQTIPMDADVVLIHGPNGSGKSSIVEALEWLFLADISRHERAKSPLEYRDSLRNTHCSQDEPTVVKATVAMGDREFVICREYQSAQRSVMRVDGNEVNDLTAIGITIQPHTRPILSQGEIRSCVDAEQADRYSEIVNILGLDVFGEFRQSLLNLKNNMNNDTMIEEAKLLSYARAEDLRQYDDLVSLSDTIVSSPYDHGVFLFGLYSCVKDICGIEVGDLSQCREALKKERNRIVVSPQLSKLNELSIPGEVIPVSDLLETLKGIIGICNQLKPIAAKMIEVRQARFLKDGLEFISDSTCPFCLQPTMTEFRKEEIHKHLKVHEEGLTLEEGLREKLDSLSTHWQAVVTDLNTRVGTQTAVKVASDEAVEILGVTSDIEELRKYHDVKLPDLRKQVEKIDKNVRSLKRLCTDLLDHKPSSSISRLVTLAKTTSPEIETVCSSVYSCITELATLKSKILSSTPGLSPDLDRKLRMIISLESLIEKTGHIKLVGVYTNSLSRLDNLQIKVEEFEKVKLREMLCDLSTEISSYFNKLNPEEPIQFTRLAVATGGRRHIYIEGESFGKVLNPVSCFSEAHVNCLGLSLYFCQRVNKNLDCDFFVLDDPVQSMDEQHADRVVDVLRDISKEKQLIVLTHQKELCDMLDDVFRHRRYIKYRCGTYTKAGPQIESEIESIENYLNLAKIFGKGNKDDRINKSAGSIRKAMEAIVKELLVAKCGVTRPSLRTQRFRLRRRLGQLEETGFDPEIVSSMRTILPIVDQPHHDDPNWDIPVSRINRACTILDDICKKYNIGPYYISRSIVGRVRDYLPKIGVAVVEVEQSFSVEDTLIIEGTSTYLRMVLESMELDYQRIDTAKPGTIVGIKVPQPVNPKDLICKAL